MNQAPEVSGTARWRCANCSRPLASAYAVCAHCEPEFTPVPRHRVAERMHLPPLHHCPACNAGFDVPATRRVPEPAPWWRWQNAVWCCPQCQAQLDWVPGLAWTQMSAWAGVGYLGWGVVMLGTNLGDQFAPFRWLSYVVALAGMGAFLCAINLAKRNAPPLPNDDWQARATEAGDLAQGHFVLHGTPRVSARQPWAIWFVLMLGVALFFGASWWRKQSDLPHHDTGPLLMLLALLLICYGALWRAWRLRQRTVSCGT